MSRDTRTRILVASLLLFNDKGVRRTTTNEIADEVDISPGNLHYHFRRKAEIVDALLAEFQADTRRVLAPPELAPTSLDDFWVFLHLLLELHAAYGFLFRDTESLVAEFPKVATALKHFARGLAATFEVFLRALADAGVVTLDPGSAATVARNLAVVALYSERFDTLAGASCDADAAALRVAAGVLNVLKPLVTTGEKAHLDELARHYDPA